MAKIHITLVGGQIMPVYLGIEQFKPDRIFFIHSQESMIETKKIQDYYKYIESELLEFDPVDYNSILKNITHLLYIQQNDDVIINITSGTKLWSIAFVLEAKKYNNITLYYIDQNCSFYNLSTKSKSFMQTPLSINKFLLFNNIKLAIEYTKFNNYNKDDLKNLAIIEEIRKFNYKDFNSLTILNNFFSKKIQENFGEIKLQTPNPSYICWNRLENKIYGVITHENETKNFSLHSPNIFNLVFNSGWFEYKIANILSKWKYTKEIWMNVKFPYKNGNIKNEIDIIVNTGHKLLFVECKTQILDQTALDKFRAAVKNYGGMGCKALFITEAKEKETSIEKCNDNNILSYSIQSNENELFKDNINGLFFLLEKNLLNINTK